MTAKEHRSAVAAIVAAAALLCSACGIDSISYLESTPRSIDRSVVSLSFSGPIIAVGSQDDGTFTGVDVFYRVYARKDDATTDQSAIVSKQGTGVPGSSIESYILAMTGKKYRRLFYQVGDGDVYQDRPALDKAESALTWVIRFDANASGAEPLVYDEVTPAASVRLLRNLGDDEPKAFISGGKPLEGDADFTAYTADEDENTFYVQFFAASYGIDVDGFQTGDPIVWSDAVWLGVVELYY